MSTSVRSPVSLVAAALAGLAVLVAACTESRAPNPQSTLCTGAACRPPACCGQPVGADGGCCVGTQASDAGLCEPPSCAACGELGCALDTATCTGTCRVPTCCLAACNGPSDCCAGSSCQATSSGVKKCFPTSCSACTGWKNFCKTTASCATSCDVPPSCGQACQSPTECGAGSTCKDFGGGTRQCVPSVFDAQCAACPFGCTFTAAGCGFACKPNPDAGLETSTSALAPGEACTACCAACGPDAGATCCAGHSCQLGKSGAWQCLPELCASCGNGCDYTCP